MYMHILVSMYLHLLVLLSDDTVSVEVPPIIVKNISLIYFLVSQCVLQLTQYIHYIGDRFLSNLS